LFSVSAFVFLAIPATHLAMQRLILPCLLLCLLATAGFAEDEQASIKFPSPDKRFALRIAPLRPGEEEKVEIIEKASGKAILDLGIPAKETKLVWSAHSKWFAYSEIWTKDAKLSVYFWNGSAFESIELPEDSLPDASPDVPNSAGAVKNYGGTVEPVRWTKPGELQCKSEATMLGRGDDRTYVGTRRFTLSFDAKHHVTIKNVGKTKTEVTE
jgi:hypothetical protein